MQRNAFRLHIGKLKRMAHLIRCVAAQGFAKDYLLQDVFCMQDSAYGIAKDFAEAFVNRFCRLGFDNIYILEF